MGSSPSKSRSTRVAPTCESVDISKLHQISLDENRMVERFLSKAIASKEHKMSLMCIMQSPGCREAFFTFLRTNMLPDVYETYTKAIDVCLAGIEDELPEEFCEIHRSVIATFLNDPIYKCWRAHDSARVMAVANGFVYSCGKEMTRNTSEDRGVLSSSNTHISREYSDCSSSQALSSIKQSDVQSVANSSSWLTKFITVIEVFPVPFSLCKVKIVEVVKAGVTRYSYSFPFVYVNKTFESLAAMPRTEIGNFAMENLVSQIGQFSFASDINMRGIDYLMRETSDANQCHWYVDCLQSVDVGCMRAAVGSALDTSTRSCADIAMKPIFDINGELLYLMAFYIAVKDCGHSVNSAIIQGETEKKYVSGLKRHIAFLQSLPHIVTEYENTMSNFSSVPNLSAQPSGSIIFSPSRNISCPPIHDCS